MDKADFIKVAPAYYALAIVAAVAESGKHLTHDSLIERYTYKEEDYDDGICLIHRAPLFRQAVRALLEAKALEVIHDHFGPVLLNRGEMFEDYVRERQADISSPFYRNRRAPNPEAWLRSALESLEETYERLGISEYDFEAGGSSNVTRIEPEEESWEPIVLDRGSPPLQEAIKSIDDTIAEVDGSNGYAVTEPEERSFVLDNLKLLSEKLKTTATISVQYIRVHGLSVLNKLADKFSGAAMGEAAKEALKALGRWLHEVFPSLF